MTCNTTNQSNTWKQYSDSDTLDCSGVQNLEKELSINAELSIFHNLTQQLLKLGNFMCNKTKCVIKHISQLNSTTSETRQLHV